MSDKELILAMAEYMELKLYRELDYWCYLDFPDYIKYNPLTNGTQLNEIVEKMVVEVLYYHGKELWCGYYNGKEVSQHKDRNTAIIKCIASVLGVDHE